MFSHLQAGAIIIFKILIFFGPDIRSERRFKTERNLWCDGHSRSQKSGRGKGFANSEFARSTRSVGRSQFQGMSRLLASWRRSEKSDSVSWFTASILRTTQKYILKSMFFHQLREELESAHNHLRRQLEAKSSDSFQIGSRSNLQSVSTSINTARSVYTCLESDKPTGKNVNEFDGNHGKEARGRSQNPPDLTEN